MKKQEAINILQQVCEQFKGTLTEHKLVQEALNVVSKEEKVTGNKEEEIKD